MTTDAAREPRVLLLTGVPGVGKTTAIRAVARRLAGRSLAGFYTEELRQHGRRQGFRLIGFGGEQGVIAHVDFPSTRRVGKYGVDVAGMDRLAMATLRPKGPDTIYLVDEIGKMECLSTRFVAAMRALLATTNPVIATIARTGAGFIGEVKARPDVVLWEITHANREAMPDRLLAWLEGGG